jgi:YidC/Oxa1 family membrane protein insertase
LTLNQFRETVDPASPPVRLLSPYGTPARHYAQVGWLPVNGIATPNGDTVWQSDGLRLTPTNPVTLKWANSTGQIFAIRYSIDQNYMVTATQSVTNAGSAVVAVRPFAQIDRTNRTASLSTQVHSGPIGAFDGFVNFNWDYQKSGEPKDKLSICDFTILGIFCASSSDYEIFQSPSKANWVGFTDIYWMSAFVADPHAEATGSFRALGGGLFRADLIYPQEIVAPHQTLSLQQRLFVGAKKNSVLEAYEAQGIPNFSLAIDWGWFRGFRLYWLAK